MVERIVEAALSLALCLGAPATARAAIDGDEPRPEAKAQQTPRTKAAEHATDGDDGSPATGKTRDPGQGVVWPGMTPRGTVVLPNGWSLKPAGRQSRLGDLPVQIAVHPGEPILAIFHAGYGEHEVVTVDGSSGRIIGRVALPASFSGLVWSADGKRLFVGGGFDDVIYRFDHADGLLSGKTVFEYPDRRAFLAERNPQPGEVAKKYQRVPAGLALTKDGKTLYVAAAFGHSLARFDASLGEVSRRIPARVEQLSLWSRAGRIAQAAVREPLEQGQGRGRRHRRAPGRRRVDD